MTHQTQIKERPILFSAPMIRAILSGNKTQTRRVLKTQPEWMDSCGDIALLYLHDFEYYIGEKPFVCPYGEPGDILWVREGLVARQAYDLMGNEIADTKFVHYAADDEPFLVNDFDVVWQFSRNSVSPIHMPKEAARIWLRVKDVRVERLQDISEEDAKAEGILLDKRREGDYYHWQHNTESGQWYCHADDAFKSLWQSINGAESWDKNPFVWVVEYEVLSTTGKPKN